MARNASRASQLFKGSIFVITGAVPGFTRKEFQADVLDKAGAFLAKGVSRSVDYVITTEDQVDNGSAKLTLAKGYGIKFVSADWLVDSMVEGKRLPMSKYTLGEGGSKKSVPKKRKKVEKTDAGDGGDDDERKAPVKKKAKKGSTKALFKGLKFAITGAVSGYTRKQFEQNVVRKLGAEVASGVTRNTDYLLSTPSQMHSGTSKLDDAKSKGVAIVSADWLVDSLNAGKKLPEADYTLGGGGGGGKSKGSTTKKKAVKKTVTKKKAAKKNSASVTSKKLFKGMVFVVSGKIPDYTRAEFKKKFVVDLGAKLGTSVTKSTDYVITTEESAESGDTAKLDAARAKGVPVVSYEWLLDCVDEDEVLDTDDFVIE